MLMVLGDKPDRAVYKEDGNMEQVFPRTEVAGVSLSRMVIGTNWMLGYSHTGQAADQMINRRYHDAESMVPMLEAFLAKGVDTIMFLSPQAPKMVRAIRQAEQNTGKKIITISTPLLNMDDNPTARAEAEQTIKQCKKDEATFCLLHHASAEQLVNKNKGTMDRLPDYTKMIRDAGMIPGLSAHMPELVIYADQNGYDVETYIQIYNCLGFLMQVEIETVAQNIHKAKKPVITIKPMAAGRCTPFVGLNFVWNTIRPGDLVAVGCHTLDEVEEDVEISLAAIERRLPQLDKRTSPAQNQAAFG